MNLMNSIAPTPDALFPGDHMQFDEKKMQAALDRALAAGQERAGIGSFPKNIESLHLASGQPIGIAVNTVNGRSFTAGDAEVGFSIQSISKLFSFTLALRLASAEVSRRIGCEPSGLSFNALDQLDDEAGIPRNPFINAGALVLIDILESVSVSSPAAAVRSFLQTVTRQPSIVVDEVVACEELEKSGRHKSMAYLMESHGNFENDVDVVLHNYFECCAIKMSCLDLAKACGFLANKGVCPTTSIPVLDLQHTKQVNSLLATCGMYNGAGDFSVKVGVPGKSGIGGGIMAIIPNKMTVCTYSPLLNENGNSVAGIAMLEHLVSELECSVF